MANQERKTGNMRKIIGVKNRVAQGKYCSTGSQKGKILLNFPLIWQEKKQQTWPDDNGKGADCLKMEC